MLYKKMFICFTVCCLVIGTQGCYTGRQITQKQLDENPELRIQRIVTIDHEVYEFPLGAFVEGDTIIGYTSDGECVTISRDRVKTMYVQKAYETKSYSCTGAAVASLILVIVFIYLIIEFAKMGPK